MVNSEIFGEFTQTLKSQMRFLLGVHPKSAIQKLSFMRVFWGVHPNSEILFSFEVFLLGSATKLPNLKVFFITFFWEFPKIPKCFSHAQTRKSQSPSKFFVGEFGVHPNSEILFSLQVSWSIHPKSEICFDSSFSGGLPQTRKSEILFHSS